MTDGEEEAADPRRGQRERPPNAVSFDDARDRAGSASRDASGIDPVSDDKRSASATFTNVPSYHQELIEGQDRLERQGIFGSDSHMPVRVMPAAQGATAPSNDDSPSTSRSQFKQSSRRHRHARSQQEARAKTNHPYQFPPNYYGYHQHQPHPYSYDYSSYYQQQQPDQDVPAFHASWPEPYSFHNYSTPSQELHPSYYSSPHHMHPSYRSPMYEDPYHQQSSRHPHSAPPSYHRGYARTTPPLGSQEMEHPQQYKETPSAITEGTTPSRHSPPLEFSPEMSALLGDNSEDDRKPAARQEPSDQAKRPSAQHIPSQETMQHPPDEFEPIPYWHEPTNSSDMFRAMYTGPFAVDPSLVGLPSHYYPTTTPQSDVASMPSQASAPTVGGEGTSWEKRFAELLEFKAKHGHCEVPQNYKDNTSLGIWVNKQRMEQKLRMEGKNSSLNDARLQRLESVGFRWAKRKGQVSWNEKFEELRAYKKKHGNVSGSFEKMTTLTITSLYLISCPLIYSYSATSRQSTKKTQHLDVGSPLNELNTKGTAKERRVI